MQNIVFKVLFESATAKIYSGEKSKPTDCKRKVVKHFERTVAVYIFKKRRNMTFKWLKNIK